MNRIILLMSAVVCLSACAQSTPPPPSDEFRDGQIRDSAAGAVAWDGQQQQWVSVEQFWVNYAGRKGGLTWGRSAEYPEYEKVNEFDTFMVELSQGPCLMEFFHSRWRRANDVQRWDPKHNEQAGCPHVFD